MFPRIFSSHHAQWALGLMLLVFKCLPLHAAAEPLYLQPALNKLDLSPYLSIAHDPDDEWSVEDIIHGRHETRFKQASETEYPGFGFVEGSIWSQFQIKNPGRQTQNWYLHIANARLQYLELHVVEGRQVIASKKTGSAMPFRERELDYRHPVFRLEVAPGEQLSLILKSKTQHSHGLRLLLRAERNFESLIVYESLLLGIFYGMILIMLMVNMGMFIIFGGKQYFYYIVYLASLWICTFTIDGLAYQFLWPEWPDWNSRTIQWLAPVVFFSALLFTHTVLDTRNNFPRLFTAIRLLLVLTVICFLSAVFGEQAVTRKLLVFTALLSFGLMIVAAFLAARQGLPGSGLYLAAWIAILATVLLWVFSLYGFLEQTVLMDILVRSTELVQFLLLALAAMVSVTALRHRQAEALEATLKSRQQALEFSEAVQRFVPDSSLELLSKSRLGDIQLGDYMESEMAVMYVDIRAFTSITERMSSRDNFDFLNRYFTVTAPVIRQNGGFVCRYIGDAMLCLFPESRQAVNAGRALLLEVGRLNRQIRSSHVPEIRVGIGVHAGEVCLAVVGDKKRMEVSPLGTAVDFAKSFENKTKQCGAPFLISEATRQQLTGDVKQYTRRLVEAVSLPGKFGWMHAYEVFSTDPEPVREAKLASREAFEGAIESYLAGDTQTALQLMQKIAVDNPEDQVARVYVSRWSDLSEGSAPDKPE